VCQVFVITDGNATNTSPEIDLCWANAATHRCFTLGVGRGTDAVLVEGIAHATGGCAAFVKHSNRFSDKTLGGSGRRSSE